MSILVEYWPHGIRSAGGEPDALLGTFAEAGYRVAVLGETGATQEIDFGQIAAHLPAFDPDRPDHCYVNLVFYK
jgi:hypothetical protein